MMRGPDNANKLASLMTKREAIAAQLFAAIISNNGGVDNTDYWQRFAVKQANELLAIIAQDER